ncbi:MAG: hypothetical protein K8Q97_03790 [Candidatus Andersenbacteria bacterium]|nr:hypothetical protein [Candidatus Andersenbacteria bacterium]
MKITVTGIPQGIPLDRLAEELCGTVQIHPKIGLTLDDITVEIPRDSARGSEITAKVESPADCDQQVREAWFKTLGDVIREFAIIHIPQYEAIDVVPA